MRFVRFMRACALALLIAVACGLIFALGKHAVGSFNALALVIVVSSGAWITAVLKGSRIRGGRTIVGIGWLCVNAALTSFGIDIVLIAFTNAVFIWLVRALYGHTSLTAAALDGGITTVSLLIAMAVAQATGQIGLALWCFYLGQAACVLLKSDSPASSGTTDFDCAFDAAQSALRKLNVN